MGLVGPRMGIGCAEAGRGQMVGWAAPMMLPFLRIELKDIEPPIWRRVAVRTSMNLKAVHRVIRVTTGWLDYHLGEFEADAQKYGMLVPDEPEWPWRRAAMPA